MSPLDTLKSEAAALRAQAQSAGKPIPHSAALEQVARRHGYNSWRACVSTLGRASEVAQLLESPAELTATRRYSNDVLGFAVNVPTTWDTFPGDPSNSQYEAIRFESREAGHHRLIVFKFPRDLAEDVDAFLDGVTGQLVKDGAYENFGRSRVNIGGELAYLLTFDGNWGGIPFYCQQYYFCTKTAYYVLGFSSTDPASMAEAREAAVASFEILGPSAPPPAAASDRSKLRTSQRDGGRTKLAWRPAQATSSADPRLPHKIARWAAGAATTLLTIVLVLGPAPMAAAGIPVMGAEQIVEQGAAASAGSGVANPRGFVESTPLVTGMPEPAYDPDIEYAAGFTDMGFGCYLQAEQDFRHALSVKPKFAKAWFMLGAAYNADGKIAAAASAFAQALKIDPQMIDARRESAVALALTGQVDKAKAELAILQARSKACGGTCGDSDLLQFSLTRVEHALSGTLTSAVQPAGEASTCSMFAVKSVRDCYTAAKFGDQHGFGAGACTKALKAAHLPDGLIPRVLVNRGVIYLADTRAKDAIADFDAAIALDGTIGDAYIDRGAAGLLLKKYDQAKADLDRGLALGSAEPQRAYYNRGLANEHLGDTKSAYADFYKASLLDPRWPAPKSELARFSFDAP